MSYCGNNSFQNGGIPANVRGGHDPDDDDGDVDPYAGAVDAATEAGRRAGIAEAKRQLAEAMASGAAGAMVASTTVVPAGKKGGEKFHVDVQGQGKMELTVPPGLRPGDTVHFKYSKQPAAPGRGGGLTQARSRRARSRRARSRRARSRRTRSRRARSRRTRRTRRTKSRRSRPRRTKSRRARSRR